MANNKDLCSACKTIMRGDWINLHLEKNIPITHWGFIGTVLFFKQKKIKRKAKALPYNLLNLQIFQSSNLSIF